MLYSPSFFLKGDLLWFSVILWLLIRVSNNEISLCASNPYTLKGQASIDPLGHHWICTLVRMDNYDKVNSNQKKHYLNVKGREFRWLFSESRSSTAWYKKCTRIILNFKSCNIIKLKRFDLCGSSCPIALHQIRCVWDCRSLPVHRDVRLLSGRGQRWSYGS